MKEWTDDKLVHFHVIYETSRRFTSHDTDMKVLQVEFCLFPRKTTNSVASGGHIKIDLTYTPLAWGISIP